MSIAGKPKPEQDANGRFLSGNIGGGRPKGSRNRLGEDFLKALAADFDEHGADVIQKVRETKPEVYLRVVADLLPKELKVEDRNPLEDLTDDQLFARVAAARRATDEILRKSGRLHLLSDDSKEPGDEESDKGTTH